MIFRMIAGRRSFNGHTTYHTVDRISILKTLNAPDMSAESGITDGSKKRMLAITFVITLKRTK